MRYSCGEESIITWTRDSRGMRYSYSRAMCEVFSRSTYQNMLANNASHTLLSAVGFGGRGPIVVHSSSFRSAKFSTWWVPPIRSCTSCQSLSTAVSGRHRQLHAIRSWRWPSKHSLIYDPTVWMCIKPCPLPPAPRVKLW